MISSPRRSPLIRELLLSTPHATMARGWPQYGLDDSVHKLAGLAKSEIVRSLGELTKVDRDALAEVVGRAFL